MLAYRHAFHAGNHADVLKHLVLSAVLRHMGEKEKPYRLIDTHAGAGGYPLAGKQAQKLGEFADGIARLWQRDDLPEMVADFVDLVAAENASGDLRYYPGSPQIAAAVMRPQDELRLFELHPAEVKELAERMSSRRHTEVHHGDGFGSLRGLLPPPSRRGVVLIDPPYEIKNDYRLVQDAVREALTRFPDCVVMVWYPQLQTMESQRLPQSLKNLAPKSWVHARMTVASADARGFGMVGSGMVVINPPWKLKDQLEETLPWLTGVLGQVDKPSFLLEHRTV